MSHAGSGGAHGHIRQRLCGLQGVVAEAARHARRAPSPLTRRSPRVPSAGAHANESTSISKTRRELGMMPHAGKPPEP